MIMISKPKRVLSESSTLKLPREGSSADDDAARRERSELAGLEVYAPDNDTYVNCPVTKRSVTLPAITSKNAQGAKTNDANADEKPPLSRSISLYFSLDMKRSGDDK
ncbi:hypothetical protein J6590_029622 [Homalodisca vitripennis]|nr:hypothetical protein J6590_029622 [Homalodisca vitripennis]